MDIETEFLCLPTPNQLEMQLLRDLGVSQRTQLEQPVKVVADVEPLTFAVAVRDAVDRPYDIAMFGPDGWSRYLGTGFALGENALANASSYFAGSALLAVREPLDWLRLGGRAVCFLDYGQLWWRSRFRHWELCAEDPQHSAEIVEAMNTPTTVLARVYYPNGSATSHLPHADDGNGCNAVPDAQPAKEPVDA